MVTAPAVLRTARRLAGLSQRGAAAAAAVPQPAIARIESGRVQPSLLTLQRLVRGCGFEIEVDLMPAPDPHDLSLLAVTIELTPEQRIDRLVTVVRTADELREAAAAAGG